MVNWTNIYFGGKVILAAIGTVAQLVLIFIIWRNGGFKS